MSDNKNMKRFISTLLIVSMIAMSGCKTSPTVTSSVLESSVESTTTSTTSETTENTTLETVAETEKQTFKYEYGVFLSYEGKLDKLADYHTVVIDAQYYKKEDIEAFKGRGHKVYSYINVGSLENFRSYYKRFKALKIARYENWNEEIWINVADSKWQEFMIGEMLPNLAGKGIDGFFVDNCDVYYVSPTSDIMTGLTNIMKALKQTGLKVIINGGDTYLDAYCKSGGSWNDVITGINQENVFAKIIWSKNKFGRASADDHIHFRTYVERYARLGADIYLLEYTTDKKLISKIDDYCKLHGFEYYVSDSIELDLKNKNY